MSSDSLISGLVAAAEPVTPRSRWHEFLILLAVGIVQVIGAVFFFGTEAVATNIATGGVAMLVKLGVFGWLALSASWLALRSYDPATPRAALGLIAPVGVAAIAALIGLDHQWAGSILETINPAHGVRCIFSLVSLALPTALLLSLLMVRGAPTHLGRTALLIGLAGGGWGAFTYALQCPYVSLWYLGVWYLAGIALVTAATRVALPSLARW
ncbi:MAG: NrsF family protein [Parvularcula sp.]